MNVVKPVNIVIVFLSESYCHCDWMCATEDCSRVNVYVVAAAVKRWCNRCRQLLMNVRAVGLPALYPSRWQRRGNADTKTYLVNTFPAH